MTVSLQLKPMTGMCAPVWATAPPFRSERQGTVIDVDTDDEQPLAAFCPPTDVVEGLERDLCEGFDSQLDQSEGRCSGLAVSRGRSHVDNPSESHVLASVVGVPGSSGVDCGRVAEVVERRHDAPKRLRLQFAGSQATTVPASRLDAPPHFEVQGCIHAGASARVEDPSSQRAGAFADESHVVDTVVDDVSTDHVEDDAQSVREGSVVGSEVGEVPDTPVECEIPGRDVRNTAAFRAALQSLDGVSLVEEFTRRPCIMKSVPKFFKGPYRKAMRAAMDEANCGVPARQERGWKLFVLLPRLLLFKNARGGTLGKEKFAKRFDMFVDGEWAELFRSSRKCAEDMANVNRRRQRRGHTDPDAKRLEKAMMLVQLGELSSARQALEGAELAPGTQTTLNALKDPSKRPPVPRDPLPRDISDFIPAREFELEEHKFARNLRSSRRGAAAGPSGMTMEHLRPLLDHPPAMHSFFLMAEQFSKALTPRSVVDGLRMGRITALQKPNGGVRGIVAGDAIRRLVSRTIAQQLGPAVERATAPYQYAMSTKAGCECIAHVLQSLCEADPRSTVISVDGVSAFDLISRESMMHGLMRVAGGGEVLPFVRQFYGQPSQYLWEDDEGITHTIPQGEGGEQGDALMPLLYSLGQHSALEAIHRQLRPPRAFAGIP